MADDPKNRPEEEREPEQTPDIPAPSGARAGEAEEMAEDVEDFEGFEDELATSRAARSAKLGSAIGSQAARTAATAAGNIGRSPEQRQERLVDRNLETALKLASTLGEMKGAAMKIGQLASFVDVEFIPDQYRELYQEQLSKLRTSAPPMPWKKVVKVLEEEYEGEPIEELFSEFEQEAFAAASIGQVHRARLPDGRRVAVKIQYPGIAEALESDLRNAGVIVRLAKALAPGLDAKAIAEELRERVLEELDYEYEAQNQRSFARAYEGHPFIYVPDVYTRLSRRRVLVTGLVEGMKFEDVRELPQAERDRFGEIVFRFCFGSIYHLQHFNADSHPGNYLLMGDGRVAFLDFGMTKKLEGDQIEVQQRTLKAAFHDNAGELRDGLAELGFLREGVEIDPEKLLEHVQIVAGWYLRDEEKKLSARYVMKVIEVSSDPRSGYYDMVRRESLPAEELMGRRMETGLLAVLAQVGATRNWHRIMREWLFAEPPQTELGREEWDYFEGRGTSRIPLEDRVR